MDNAFDLGNERLINAIRQIEILNLFFPRIGYSLILDTRHDAIAPPAIIVDPMVGSPQARLESFKRLRPHFPAPDKIGVAPWLGSTRSLVEGGIYDAIVARWSELGYGDEGEAEATRAFRELARLERAALRDLLSGASGRTIWQRRE